MSSIRNGRARGIALGLAAGTALVAAGLVPAGAAGAANSGSTKSHPAAPAASPAAVGNHTVSSGALGAAKGKPSAPAVTTSAATCSLPASPSRSAKSEWASCLSVSAKLSSVPAVGQTATLTITVLAGQNLPDAHISAILPKNLVWVKAPTGLAVTSKLSKAPESAGVVSEAAATMRMTKGQQLVLVGTVKALAGGNTHISVRATSASTPDNPGGSDDVFANVGATTGLSKAGFSSALAHSVTSVPASTTLIASTPRAFQSVGTAGLPKLNSSFAPCDTIATGNWVYTDQNGVSRPSRNFLVQVFDRNTFGDALLAQGVTDGSGHYSLCFNSDETGIFESGTADVYLKFVAENSIWKVQNGGSLNFSTGVHNDVTPGVTLNFGFLTAGDSAYQRGLHAFDELNDAWNFIPKPNNICFDQNDSSCRQYVVNWSPTSTDGTYYSLGGNDVHLAADDPNAAITVVHETSHAIMDDVYNDAFPSAPNCNPHSIQGTSSAGCAWTEGFAEWLPATIYNDPFFRWPGGQSLDLENQSWNNGWGSGDTTEGRIAGSLIDVTDSNNEAYWDSYGEGFTGIWYTFTHHVSNTLGDFFNQRGADGFNNSDFAALSDFYQNTVDYGFRDPLGNYATKNRPTPNPTQNYGFNTTTNYWSVVAVRPPSGADYDLTVYDDRGLGSILSGSGYGGNTVDFVAIDSNRRAFGDYYPRVNVFAGSGNYDVQLAQGAQVLNAGNTSIPMGFSDVVAVRDVFLTAGTTTTFRATPSNGGQDAQMFIMGDDAANASTFLRPRGSALAFSTSGGAGASEQLAFTAPTSAWYGFVLVNASGSGTYTVTRDATAPDGSLLINGGATDAVTRPATLTLSASDPESGVAAMRISTDGVMDTEAWIAYSPTASIRLAGANGVKTVLAQYRNGLGLTGPVVSDTINLTMPDMTVVSLTEPPVSKKRGLTFSVSDTTKNIGLSSAVASKTQYTLSTDRVASSGDRALTPKRNVPALAAGARSFGTVTVTIPAGTTPGLYYLIACSDATNVVGEAIVTNNCRASFGRVNVTS